MPPLAIILIPSILDANDKLSTSGPVNVPSRSMLVKRNSFNHIYVNILIPCKISKPEASRQPSTMIIPFN
jgi:hypothetical protein